MNLTSALNLHSIPGAAEVPAVGLPGAEGAAENGAIAGFAELLAGLTPQSAGDPEAPAAPVAEQEDSEAAPAVIGPLQDGLPASGKSLPPATGKDLPEALHQSGQAQKQASEAAQIAENPVLVQKSQDTLSKAATDPSPAPIKAQSEQAAAPKQVHTPASAQPLQLQVTASTLAPRRTAKENAAKPADAATLSSDKTGANVPEFAKANAPLASKPSAALATPLPAEERSAQQSTMQQPTAPQAAAQTSIQQPGTAIAAGQLSLVTPTLSSEPAAPALRAAPDSQPQDFEAVVQRLAEARENARSADTSLRVLTREFGQVAMQFEIAGRALKVSLASQDVAFAPAVQAALADRGPLVVSEAVRPETSPGRGDTSQHSGQTGQNSGSQSAGANGNPNGSQAGAAKPGSTNSQQPQTDDASDASTRGHGLFA